jgi:outer membrane protein
VKKQLFPESEAGRRKMLRMKKKIMILIGINFLISVPAGMIHADEKAPLTLSQCIDIALKQSPSLKSSEYDVAASQESVKGAKGALFPRVDLNAGYTRENRPIPFIPAQSPKITPAFSDEIYFWNVFLRMPIYEGGKLSGQVKISEIEKEIQSSRKEFTTQDVIANVTNTFNKLLQLKEFRVANLKSVEALERQQKNTKLFVETGRTAKVELLRVEVQLASERQNLIRTEETINRARYALAYFMGGDLKEVPDVEGRLSTEEQVTAQNIDELLKSRPDIVASSRRVEQSKARVDVASSRRYPSISLFGNYGHKAGVEFDQRYEMWQAGVLGSINIFDAGIISSEIRREKISHQKAQEELKLATLKARLEVDNALSSFREAENKLSMAKKAMEQSEETLRIEELKYTAGAGTITDVLLAQSAMSLAQANYYQALYDFNAASTEFKRTTGTIGVKR